MADFHAADCKPYWYRRQADWRILYRDSSGIYEALLFKHIYQNRVDKII